MEDELNEIGGAVDDFFATTTFDELPDVSDAIAATSDDEGDE